MTGIVRFISTSKAENMGLSTLTTNPKNPAIKILNLAVGHSVSCRSYRATEPLGGVSKTPALQSTRTVPITVSSGGMSPVQRCTGQVSVWKMSSSDSLSCLHQKNQGCNFCCTQLRTVSASGTPNFWGEPSRLNQTDNLAGGTVSYQGDSVLGNNTHARSENNY